ncbi:hypothetical protein ACOMHN_040612 [Nucella lapillus]
MEISAQGPLLEIFTESLVTENPALSPEMDISTQSPVMEKSAKSPVREFLLGSPTTEISAQSPMNEISTLQDPVTDISPQCPPMAEKFAQSSETEISSQFQREGKHNNTLPHQEPSAGIPQETENMSDESLSKGRNMMRQSSIMSTPGQNANGQSAGSGRRASKRVSICLSENSSTLMVSGSAGHPVSLNLRDGDEVQDKGDLSVSAPVDMTRKLSRLPAVKKNTKLRR